LLRPRVDTIETSLETPMVIQLVEALIEVYFHVLPRSLAANSLIAACCCDV